MSGAKTVCPAAALPAAAVALSAAAAALSAVAAALPDTAATFPDTNAAALPDTNAAALPAPPAPPALFAGHAETTSQAFMDALAAAEPAGEPEWYAIGDPDPVLGAPPSRAAGPTVTCALVRAESVARAWAEAVRRCAALRRYVAHCRNLVAVGGDEIKSFDDFLDVMFEADLDYPIEHEISLVTSSSDLTRAAKRARP